MSRQLAGGGVRSRGLDSIRPPLHARKGHRPSARLSPSRCCSEAAGLLRTSPPASPVIHAQLGGRGRHPPLLRPPLTAKRRAAAPARPLGHFPLASLGMELHHTAASPLARLAQPSRRKLGRRALSTLSPCSVVVRDATAPALRSLLLFAPPRRGSL